MLEGQRRELLDQLAAIDRAIAALGGAGADVAEAPAAAPAVEHAAATVLPKQFKPRRVLSDSHKHALKAGKRRARDAHDVARGLAREMPGEGFVPAIGTRGDRQLPRLVTKTVKK
jgi:hypothetical protein